MEGLLIAYAILHVALAVIYGANFSITRSVYNEDQYKAKRVATARAFLVALFGGPVGLLCGAVMDAMTEAELSVRKIGSGVVDQDAGALSVHEPQLKVLPPPSRGAK